MSFLIQFLTYASFAALCIFGLLTYFKDHKMYPMYSIGFKLSVIATSLFVSIEIFLALPNVLGIFVWIFFASLAALVYFIVKMTVAKTMEKKLQQRNFAIGAIVVAVAAMVVLMVFAAKMK